MFIRFVVGADDEHHRLLTGIITEARILRDENKLHLHEQEWLETIYDWFDTHLPHPPFSSGRFPQDAVAWFKAESGDFIGRMWDIVAIIREHDVPVRLLKSQNPGKILYEDEYQVVVKEWRELRIEFRNCLFCHRCRPCGRGNIGVGRTMFMFRRRSHSEARTRAAGWRSRPLTSKGTTRRIATEGRRT